MARGAFDSPGAVPGSGPVALGGLSFSGDDPGGGPWSAFGAATLIVPAVALARRDAETWLTVTVRVEADDTVEELLVGIERRLAGLRIAPLPLYDPAPVGETVVRSVMPPSHYEEAVARAVQRIRAGELEKVVLAREVEVIAPAEHDPAAVLGVLREAFAVCFVYAVGRGEATFLGASPELLVRREGARASTVALAGSTRRSADPGRRRPPRRAAAAQRQGPRGERDRRPPGSTRALRPHAVWVTVAPEPGLVQVANIQHLGRCRSAPSWPDRSGAIELAGLLHPTPAVGGEPWPVAERLLPALEGFDRGLVRRAVRVDRLHAGTASSAWRCGVRCSRGRHARAVRRRRDRRGLRPRRRARRDRGQAPGAASAARGLVGAQRVAARRWPPPRPRGGAPGSPRARSGPR